jgi:uncharacterized glyoxalase superfamily protein PhnB
MAAPPAQVNLHVPDVGKSFEYFTGVLGFKPEFRVRREAGDTVFAGVRWGSVGRGPRIILGDIHEALHGHYDHGAFGQQMKDHPLGTGVVLYYYVPDVDKHHAALVKRGAVIDEPPTDQFWGDRTISVLTPEGFYVTFATPLRGFRFPPGFAARIELSPGGWRHGLPPKRRAAGAGKRKR